MPNSEITSLANEARRFVESELEPIFAKEPRLFVEAPQYEFRVKFIGKQVADPKAVIEELERRWQTIPEISLYAHIPRCKYRCNFCTYAVTITGNPDEDAARLLKEKNLLQGTIPIQEKPVSSLYFGGGTPTMLSSQAIFDLVNGFASELPTNKKTEVTMEGSPDTITKEKVDSAKKAGVNRFSVGVQTFNQKILDACNRGHTAEQAEQAIRLLCESGFREVNVDLMRGLPSQTLEGFIGDLLKVIRYNPETVHVYRMRLMRQDELKSIFGIRQNELELPSVKDIAAMQYAAKKLLEENGYSREHTGAWSKVKPKVFEDRWDKQIPLIAFGWRAYSLFPFGEWHNPEQLSRWRSLVDEGKIPIEKAWQFGQEERELRWLLFKLKTSGVSPKEFEKEFGKPFSQASQFSTIQKLQEIGVLHQTEKSLKLSKNGAIVGEEAIRLLSRTSQ